MAEQENDTQQEQGNQPGNKGIHFLAGAGQAKNTRKILAITAVVVLVVLAVIVIILLVVVVFKQDKCTLPTVESMDMLQGGTLDHKGVLSDLTCGDGKLILGGTEVSCEDGTLTWTGTPPTQPECLDKCTLPTVEYLDMLQGGTLDHKGVLSDLTCGDGKLILGGTEVSCEDGTLTWTGTPPTQPECSAAEMTTTATQFQASEDYVYDGDEVSFTCTYKNPQSLIVPTVNWVATGTAGAINVGTPDRSAASSSPEGKEVITFTATAAHSGTYTCDCVYPDSIGTVSSAIRTLHVIGVKPAATVYLGEGGSGKLTCTFTGRSGTVSWAKVGASTDLSSRVTTGLYKDGEITSKLSFTDAQYDTDEGQYDCVITFDGITETKTLQPRLRIMRVTEVSVTPDSRVADSSSEFTLTCKVSWDVSDLSYVPAVTWTFTGAGVKAETLTNQADQFVYTKASAAPADMGKYECSVDFDGAPNVAENTLYVRSTPTLTLEIEDAPTNLVTPSAVILGYAVTFTCTLSGDTTGNVVWYKGSSVISDRQLYEFSEKTDTAYGATSTATVKPVADATSQGDYKCKSTYTSDSVATESSPITLEVLGATGLTSSKQYVNKGDDVTLQCDYVELAGDNTPATWTVAGVTTPAPDPNTASSSTVTVTGTTVVNNGVAECTVLYKNSLTNSVSITQYVRAVEFQNIVNSVVYGLKGTTVILSCVLYGDELDGDVTWYKDNIEIDSSDSLDNKTPATELYEAGEYKTTSTLKILAATVATDRGTYKCEGTRKHDSVKTSNDQDLSIVTMSVTGTTTVNHGGDTTLQCTTNPADDIAASYTWKKQDQLIDSQTAASLPLTNAAWDVAAGYKCAIVFKHSLGDMESDPVYVFVQGFVSVVQEKMAGNYNEAGETITLRAVIRSEEQPDTFSLKRNADTDPTAITNTPSATRPVQDWTVDVEFEAKKVTVDEGAPKNAVYKLSIGTMSGVEFDITLTIYEKCPLPTVEYLSELQGGTLDHKGVLTDLTCGDGKPIFGGTGVSCEDGTLTWTGIPSQQPKCLDKCTLPTVEYLDELQGGTLDNKGVLTDLTCGDGKYILGGTAVSCENGVLIWTGTPPTQPECSDWFTITDEHIEVVPTYDYENYMIEMGSIPYNPSVQAVRFYVKFTLKKTIDKALSNYVFIYISNELGQLTAILRVVYRFDSLGKIEGSEKLYLQQYIGSCSESQLINYLPAVDHTMTIDLGSPILYSTTSSDGTSKSLDISKCSAYDNYIKAKDESAYAETKFSVKPDDFLDYVELQYKFEVYYLR